MSHNLRYQLNEEKASSGRTVNENNGRPSGDGFEGMNYEQRRPAYRPQQVNNCHPDLSNNNNDRREEF
jgi:hypothetical protein